MANYLPCLSCLAVLLRSVIIPVDLSQSLVIGISSRALFNLEEANAIFEEKGEAEYIQYQQANERKILRPGTGFRLVEAILGLNQKVRGGRRAEVVVMSRNNPAAAMRFFRSIEHYELDIQRAVLSGGTPLSRYLKAFCVDLYLSAYESDVREAIDAGVAAAVIYGTPKEEADPCDELRIAFDGDAVLFSNEAEHVYQEQGLEKFIEHERRNAKRPLPAGPFAKLFRTLFLLQRDPGFDRPPIRTALITARNMPAHLRVLNTFRAWRIHVDEAFFMGGVPKTEVLRAFRPHIFFDDQDLHCGPASEVVSTARVPAREQDSRSDAPRKGQRKKSRAGGGKGSDHAPSPASAAHAIPAEVLASLGRAEQEDWLWLASQETVSSSEYARAVGLQNRAALNHLRRFTSLGLLEKIGSGSATRYRVLRGSPRASGG